jgi:hypothetical protein
MTADALLSRLDRVKRTGPGKWIASCPSHDDRNPSLAIRECDDGRILLHDFAGCAVADVVAALGMALSDLMPERAIDHRVRRERKAFFPSDVFDIALREVSIVALIACDIHSNKDVQEADYQRLLVACGRLNSIAEKAYAH